MMHLLEKAGIPTRGARKEKGKKAKRQKAKRKDATEKRQKANAKLKSKKAKGNGFRIASQPTRTRNPLNLYTYAPQKAGCQIKIGEFFPASGFAARRLDAVERFAPETLRAAASRFGFKVERQEQFYRFAVSHGRRSLRPFGLRRFAAALVFPAWNLASPHPFPATSFTSTPANAERPRRKQDQTKAAAKRRSPKQHPVWRP